jgi:uncharacterized protein YndB with AHSA1/START domain
MSRNDREPARSHLARAEIEVPGSPEEVWQAIATGPGNAAWLFPADIEGSEGATMRIHRQPFADDATATVTTWDPPHRFAYQEPLAAADGSAAAAPLATEILVEARGGGTCIVRVVSGLHHDSDGWEDLVEGAGAGWRMALTVLRGYLTHFAGQPAARVDAIALVGRPMAEQAEVGATVLHRLGLTGLSSGQGFRTPAGVPALAGTVEHLSPTFVLLRAREPGPALFAISSFPMDGSTLSLNVTGRCYGPDGPVLAERERPRWRAWLASQF